MTTSATPQADPHEARRAQVRSLLLGASAAQRADTAVTAIPAAGPDARVASYSQERMWLLEQMMPGYNTSTVIRVRGVLDTDVLARSFTVVAGRHEVLRTVFDERDGAPVPRVLPAAPVTVRVHDVVGNDAGERYAAGVEFARELMREPFSLADGPVFRVAVARLAEDDALLILVVHHIAIDGTSMRVLWSELSRAYAALAAGREPELPPLPLQYGDYAAWSRTHQTPERLGHQLKHWRERLAGASADELPTDRPRPTVRTGNGSQFSFTVDGELGAAVNRFSREHNATAFMTLTAAFSVVLARHSATRDVTLGTPIAGRGRPELDGLIGYFVNTLLIRTELADDPSFEELLVRTRANTLASYEHQELPFEALLAELQPERDPSRNPLFQVLFALGDEETDDLVLPGLTTERVELVDGKSRFDLNVALTRSGDTFSGIAYYEADLFEQATISRLMRHFVTFLRNALAEPDRPVSGVGMVDAAERDRLLAAGSGERVEFSGGLLTDLVDAVAARAPHAPAVTDSRSTLTYAELTGRANHLAARLREAKVAPDTPVGLWMDRSAEMTITLLAILKAGGAFLPLDPDLPVGRVKTLLTDAGAPVICVDGHRAQALTTTPTEATGALTVLDCGPGTLTRSSPTPPDNTITGDNLISVYYTSGSTGTPKGVASTHTGWTNRMQWMQAQYPLTPGDTVLHKTVLSFDDSAVEIFWPLIAGATVVMLPPGLHRDPRAIADWSNNHHITALHFVPSMLNLFLDEITPTRQPLTHLRHVISSGEALRPDLVTKFHQRLAHTPAHLHNQWGATEVSIDSTSHTCTPQDEQTPDVSLGNAIANNQVLILDEHLNPVPDGVPGELYLGGTGLARGYLHDPRKTAAAFLPHPYHHGERLYRTGDRGIRRPDGRLTFLGRTDSQVKIRGIRIEPAEIEHTLRRHPAIRDAVVTKWEPAPGDQRLAAYITLHHPTTDNNTLTTDINTHLADRLPLYMIPSTLTVLDHIPVNANGKTDHHALPRPTTDTHTPTTRANGPAEELIARTWSDVLNRPDLDIHANFFALGGHSLLATRIISRLRTTLSPDIPLALIFDNPTIHTMATAIGHLMPASGTADGRTSL
ncbi:amino acid adenylation domain-containing protein [Streptomyces sp. B3I7]|uniref:non-ribosomal peptide synthetase n=1 Tax=Streptomyces sp. B3I7 TaxID=3042269 RepID=UPI00278754B1|nr:amino acid adenylation domain-containing protein [Streptomyces sp. B3I7]MDQ0815165.1 amino acid adenylation domain-containing protein [Streptomyces sp. B3I7]